MRRFEPDEATDEETAAEVALYQPLTAAVRDLVDATIRTLADPDQIARATEEIAAVTARLRAREIPGSYGVKYRADGNGRAWGNAVVGVRNPIAPPLTIATDPDGRAASAFHLGAAYEGPPGLVHGGVVALILDQVLGHAVGAGGFPGMTGTLTTVYRRATPLGDLRCEGWIDRVDGVKTWARGHVLDADGEVTAEAEGVFILPRWARKTEVKPAYFE